MDKTVSELDKLHLRLIRENIAAFLTRCADTHATRAGRMLDVAPQDHEGARPYFPSQVTVETLDIDPDSGATYIADLCRSNEAVIPSGRFDYVVCTEVLEHVRRPFAAVEEIRRILAPGGMAFVTTPFNFRIHGPLPDCWRFTEHGLRELFTDFELVELSALEAEDRFLMPIQYMLVAQKPAA